MKKIEELKSYPYLNEIKKKLWENKVAVMIGAGFSKNATKEYTTVPEIPNWVQLGNIFEKEMYSNISSSTKDPIKLAEEYESIFGRAKLENLMIKSIPDKGYIPNDIFEKFLKLPWNDVFTTNYDTLLERASNNIYNKKYDIVEKIEQIPYSRKPRIIKLHGSFETVSPFIITEEDYRTYPKKFAPFVNTVQQSLLENDFCLIGFSGDDPNFKSWIGWIRDNLGEYKANIYLIGIFSFSEPELRRFEKLNIRIIDFSELFDTNDNQKYNKMINLFIKFLQEGESESPLEWMPNHFHQDKKIDLINILEELSAERKSYPNWLVPNKSIRDEFSSQRNFFWSILFSKEFSLESNNIKIDFLYELVWRLDKSFLPILYSDVLLKIEEIIENIFEGQGTEKYNIIVIKLLYEYKMFDKIKFERLADKIHSSMENNEILMELSYLESLFFIENLSFNRAFNLSEKLEKSNDFSIDIKRIYLLNILNKEKPSEDLLQIIDKIRKIQKFDTSFELRSIEGVILTLIDYNENIFDIKDYNEYSKNKFSRLKELDEVECNFYEIIRDLETQIKLIEFKYKSPKTESKPFDLNRITNSVSSVKEGYDIEDVLPAFQLITLMDKLGYPYSIKNFLKINEESILKALDIVSYFNFGLAINFSLRNRVMKVISNDKYLSRERIFLLDDEEINDFNLLINNWNQLSNDEILSEELVVFNIFLSKLTIRISQEYNEKIMHRLLEIYENSEIPMIREKTMKSFINRTWKSLSSINKGKFSQKIYDLFIKGIVMIDINTINSDTMVVNESEILKFWESYETITKCIIDITWLLITENKLQGEQLLIIIDIIENNFSFFSDIIKSQYGSDYRILLEICNDNMKIKKHIINELEANFNFRILETSFNRINTPKEMKNKKINLNDELFTLILYRVEKYWETTVKNDFKEDKKRNLFFESFNKDNKESRLNNIVEAISYLLIPHLKDNKTSDFINFISVIEDIYSTTEHILLLPSLLYLKKITTNNLEEKLRKNFESNDSLLIANSYATLNLLKNYYDYGLISSISNFSKMALSLYEDFREPKLTYKIYGVIIFIDEILKTKTHKERLLESTKRNLKKLNIFNVTDLYMFFAR